LHPLLHPLAARLEADLRLRFPDITVRFVRDDDGAWECRVADGPTLWGETGTWFDDRDDLSSDDAERLLADVTSSVADNLWPDELTDPWPLCPRHGDHPLQPQLAAGRASWLCRREPGVAIAVGALVAVP